MGYEEVGQIVEVGSNVTRLTPGQIVLGTWQHRSEHVAAEDWAAARLLPEGVDPRLGIFSQIGAIALNAILDAGIRLGETEAIFGQGVPGLMVTQLALLSGATVIAVDVCPRGWRWRAALAPTTSSTPGPRMRQPASRP